MVKALNIPNKRKEREENEVINRMAPFFKRGVEDTRKLLKGLSKKYDTYSVVNKTIDIKLRKDNDNER